jgi:ariadne-1
MMTGLECGHLYCTSCWTEYLTTKIMDEGASQTIACPASQCDILVSKTKNFFFDVTDAGTK